jgi:hypothetical protein
MLIEICAVTHFLWLKNLANPEISHEIDFLYEVSIIVLSVIQKWTHCFEQGQHRLEDGPGRVVPSQLNMLTHFMHYCSMIHTFHKNGLLAFWPFT